MQIVSAGSTYSPAFAAPTAASGLASPSAVGGLDTPDAAAQSVESQFKQLADMSPMERMRAQILQGMHLTESQLNALPADERKMVEDKIKDQIKQKMGGNTQAGQLVNVSA